MRVDLWLDSRKNPKRKNKDSNVIPVFTVIKGFRVPWEKQEFYDQGWG